MNFLRQNFFLFLGVDLKWKIAKKISKKKTKFLFKIVIYNRDFQNVQKWQNLSVKKYHYWHFLLFQNNEKATFSAPLCSKKNPSTPSHIGGNFFVFHFFAQGNRVFSAFVHGTLVTLTIFFQKKNFFSGVHFEKKWSKNYIYT